MGFSRLERRLIKAEFANYKSTAKLIRTRLKRYVVIFEKLKELGIIKDYIVDGWCLKFGRTIQLDQTKYLQQLMAIRKHIGKLKHDGQAACDTWDKQPEDYICVTVKLVDDPQIRFKYFRRLDPKAKCQLVTEVTTTKTLICPR